MEFNVKRLLELLEEEGQKTSAIRKYCLEQNIEFNESVRKRAGEKMNSGKIISPIEEPGDVENSNITDSNNYSNDKLAVKGFNAIGEDGKLMAIEQYCEYYGLDYSKVRSYKIISHTGIPFYNCVFYTVDEEVLLDIDSHLDEIVSKYIKPITFEYSPKTEGVVVTRAIYTDQHIGMEIDETGNALYGGKWDKEELLRRGEVFSNFILNKAIETSSNELIIDNLGDTLDGWNGETTRGGHLLPQNMTNSVSFDTGVEFTLKIIDTLVESGQFKSILCNNICEDNHSGEFGYILNSAVAKILGIRYKGLVTVNNMQKFINHYSVGEHCFMLSHGKDSKLMKSSLKVNLDPRGAEKIDQYMKINGLYKDYKFFEFSKGNDHQMLFDYCTSDDFDYMNYPAFSPPSQWVTTNFKRGRNGFVVQSFEKNKKERCISYHFFS